MSNIQWDESLSVGVGLIDEQHRKWIERLHEVESAIKSRRGMQQIVSTLDFLSEYTRFHFSTEDQYMVQACYPGLENHRAKHEELEKTLGHLIEDFKEDGVTEKISEAVGIFLGNWLKDHIRVVDQVFAAFLKEKNIQLT
jgi:hemerythrin